MKVTILNFQINHGSCIFATTRSDNEIAAEKCDDKSEFDENDEFDKNSFDGNFVSERTKECAKFLRDVTDKFGTGDVFALYDYTSVRDDEISFKSGDKLTVVRRGDDQVIIEVHSNKLRRLTRVPIIFQFFFDILPCFSQDLMTHNRISLFLSSRRVSLKWANRQIIG